MRVLISPVSVEEARAVRAGGADIIDVKNVAEGSLGASFPRVIRAVADAVGQPPVTISATLGDLPYKPGTAALAALGAVTSGARYVKAGLHGVADAAQAAEVMRAVCEACKDAERAVRVVAAGYADYRRFGGIAPDVVLEAATLAGCDGAMLDTAFKDGPTLFDALTEAELAAFVTRGRALGLEIALAGSVGVAHVDALRDLGTDIVGVRGAVCGAGDRRGAIAVERVRAFVETCRAG
jgi:uncharacterized protein (UPF0264 family)